MIVLGRREASKAEVNIMAYFMAKMEYSTKIVFFQYVLNTSVSAITLLNVKHADAVREITRVRAVLALEL